MGNRKSPYITPPLRAWRLDAPRSPGVHGVCLRECNVVEGGGVDVTGGSGVQAMEVRYNIRRVYVPMNDPGVVANVVAPPLDQVFQAVPAHAQIQYGLYFVLFLAFHENQWRRGPRAMADYRVGSSQSELDNGEDQVQSGKTWRELQMVCAMANMSVDWI